MNTLSLNTSKKSQPKISQTYVNAHERNVIIMSNQTPYINAYSSKIRESVNQFKMRRTKLSNEELLEHRSMGALSNWHQHIEAWQEANNNFCEKNDNKKGLTE